MKKILTLRPLCCNTVAVLHLAALSLITLAALFLSSCEAPCDPAAGPSSAPAVHVTFAIEGDFQSPTFTRAASAPSGFPARNTPATRATLSGDGGTMTDLYVLDYMSGTLVQQLHQTADDADFGTPTLSLAIGDHDLYFVCSRGASPTLSTDEHTVTWLTPRDTFWAHLAKTVTTNTAAAQAVTLARVATRLSVTLTDAIADGTAAVEICPHTWYYGLDYLSGNAVSPSEDEPVSITVPASYAGRTNTKLAIFGLGRTAEFTTDVTVTALDASSAALAAATITAAPFQQNRSTDYSGRLFSAATGFTLTLNTTWADAYTGQWE